MKVYKGKNKGRYVLKTVKSGPNKGKKYRVYLKAGQKAPATKTKKRATKKVPAKKVTTKKAPAKKVTTKKAPAVKKTASKQSKSKAKTSDPYAPSGSFVRASGYDYRMGDIWVLPARLLKKNRKLPLEKRVAQSFPKNLASKIAANFDLDDYKNEEDAKAIISRVRNFFEDLIFYEALKAHKKRKGPITDSGSPIFQEEDIAIELMDEDEFPKDFRWKSSPWGPLMKKEGLGEKNDADYE